jgi:two-component system chemotaxis response regulator CheY
MYYNKMILPAVISRINIQAQVAQNISAVLSDFFGTLVSSLDFKILKDFKTTNINSLGLLRFTSGKNSNYIILGTSDATTYKTLKAIEESRLAELESLLIGALKKSVITPAIQDEEIAQLIMANEFQIGFLKKIESNHILHLSFQYNESQLIFEIPLESPVYKLGTLLQNTGFPDLAKILIVDDSKVNRIILKNYLSSVGFVNIEEAEDGKMALAKIKQSLSGYDLIIADWHMPEMNGIDLLRELRTNIETKLTTPFILATSEQKREEILLAVKFKVSGYMIKPYSADKLFESMKTARATIDKK